jgi:Flp pilus assembly protein TadG
MGGTQFTVRKERRDERGQMLLLFAAALPVLLAVFAMAVDLGGAAVTYHRAQVAMDAAVFAGAQALDVRVYATGQQVVVNEREAVQAAHAALAGNMGGFPMEAAFFADGAVMKGSGTAAYNTLFLCALGIHTIPCRVASSATPGWGIEEENQ